MRVILDVLVILRQDLAEELVLGVMDGLDNEPVVAREIEERPRLAWRTELREDVLRREGKEVVCGIEMEVLLPQLAENPWGIVLELKIILR